MLEIEKGRHRKPKIPKEMRFCNVCNTGMVEDEEHFLCICPVYSNLRRDFISKCHEIGVLEIESHFTLPFLMNCMDISFHLAKLLEKCLLNVRNMLCNQPCI